MLTAEKLKEVLLYNPKTGVFTWTERVARNVFSEAVAGTVDSRGYLKIKLNRKSYYGHRLAWLYMTGTWPVGVIDHINRNTQDLRWVNLREVTISQNNLNRGDFKNNRSGVKGVAYCRTTGRWLAYYRTEGKTKTMRFSTQNEAVSYRQEHIPLISCVG